jgi:hypothetical protein
VLNRFQNELKFHCEELPLESMFTFSWTRMWILAFFFNFLFLGTATGEWFFCSRCEHQYRENSSASSAVAYPFFWIYTYEMILNHDKVCLELFYHLGKRFN